MSLAGLREKLGVNKQEKVDFQISYSHSDTHMHMMFGRVVDNLTFTVEQIDEVIRVLGELRASFIKHKENKSV